MSPRPVARRDELVDALDRFTAKYEINPVSGCWLWQASRDKDGYGLFSNERRRTVRAHRWSYEHFVGPIPDGYQIDHVLARGCTNRSCVNPEHLEPVTPQVNTLRGFGPAGVNARKQVCPQGHPYDEANTMICDGRRFCRECGREQTRRSRSAKVAA